MKLIIDIHEKDYQSILNSGQVPYGVVCAIMNGTPLPEPFDLEGLKTDMKSLMCGFPYGLDYLLDCLDKRLGITIIEADKEG